MAAWHAVFARGQPDAQRHDALRYDVTRRCERRWEHLQRGHERCEYQNLLSFTGTGGAASGEYPLGSLTLSGTTLYGMTSQGGTSGNGNVFSVGLNGANYQNLLSFTGTGGAASGEYPQEGSLTVCGTTLYGMTAVGGAGGDGNIFSVGTNGTNYQNLLSFTGTGGAASGLGSFGSLTLSGSTLYGMTDQGGADGHGNIFSAGIDGSDYLNLYSFTGGTDQENTWGDLTLSGGTLFGMTAGLGVFGYNGTVFALDVPEPGTISLVAASAIGLLGYGWRRRRVARRTVKPAAIDRSDAPPILSFPSHSFPASAARTAA